MQARESVFVPLQPEESIASVRQIVISHNLGERSIKYVDAVMTHNSHIHGCEVDDVFEMDTSNGRSIFGKINSAGEFVRLRGKEEAESYILKD